MNFEKLYFTVKPLSPIWQFSNACALKLFPDSQFIDLISRDIESFQGPLAVGHKYITGTVQKSVKISTFST